MNSVISPITEVLRQAAWALAVAVVALLIPRLGAGVLRIVLSAAARVCVRRWAAPLLLACLGCLAGASVTLILGVPRPTIHDEFSYLLAADTYAHGRLANPTPPLYQSFETFHELMRPTYASKYPPGQGAALALGQILFHLPIAGIWLATGCLAACLYWAFTAWMPRRWAFLAALFGALNLSVLGWSGGYWGGTLAAFGGALVLGGVRWGARVPDGSAGTLLGFGIGVLFVTRMYEGLIYTLAMLGVLLIWTLRAAPALRLTVFRRVWAPAGAMVLLSLFFIGLAQLPQLSVQNWGF